MMRQCTVKPLRRIRVGWSLIILVMAFYAIEIDFPLIGDSRPAYAVFSAMLVLSFPFLYKKSKDVKVNDYPIYIILSYILYFIVCLFGNIWYNDRLYSISQLSVLFLCIVGALCGAGVSRVEMLRALILCGLFVLLLSWAALLVSPEFALQQKVAVQEMGLWRLKGVMGHEMRLASAAVITFLSALYILKYCSVGFPIGKRYIILIGLLSFLTLVATQARAITGYAVVVTALLLCFGSRLSTRLVIFYMALACAFALWMVGLDAALSPFARGEADLTLTGRTMIWERTLTVADERPWLGHGFSSFGSPDYDSMWGRYRPAVAHNVWIDAYFELGIPGVIALAFVHIAMLRAAWRAQPRPGQISLSFCLVLFATLCGLTGVGIGGRLQTIVGICIMALSCEYAHFVRSRGEVLRRRRSVSVRHSPLRAPQSRFGNLSR